MLKIYGHEEKRLRHGGAESEQHENGKNDKGVGGQPKATCLGSRKRIWE